MKLTIRGLPSPLLPMLRLAIARPRLTVAVSLALAVLGLAYAWTTLTFETSSVRLLPPHRVYVQQFEHDRQEFGELDEIGRASCRERV